MSATTRSYCILVGNDSTKEVTPAMEDVKGLMSGIPESIFTPAAHDSSYSAESNARTSVLRRKLELGSWAVQAACITEDPDVFFPEHSNNEAIRRDQTRRATRICAGCIVQEECLEYALDNHDDMLGGIFGGLTYDERARLVRRDRRPQSRTA